MPYKQGYGMKAKPKDFGIKKTKVWGQNLKGNPKPKQMTKGVK